MKTVETQAEAGMSRSELKDIVPLVQTLEQIIQMSAPGLAAGIHASAILFTTMIGAGFVADDRNAASLHQLVAEIHELVHRLMEPNSEELAFLKQRFAEGNQPATDKPAADTVPTKSTPQLFLAKASKEVH